MPKRNRRSKKSAMILPVLLIGSSVLVTCVGFALKARLKTVGGTNGSWLWPYRF